MCIRDRRSKIPKGAEKSVKKQIEAEYNELKAQMEQQQQIELASLEGTAAEEPGAAAEEEGTDTDPGPKKSKAQKRREKREAEEAARDAEIAQESEKASTESRAALERQALTAKLSELGLAVKDIAANGHCLYSSIAHQLEARGQVCLLEKEFKNEEMPLPLFKAVRRAAAQHLRQHKSAFEPFLESMEGDDPYEAHCESVEGSADWGGHMELAALSAVFGVPIRVYEATAPDCDVCGDGAEGQPLLLSFHRHMYALGEHYNSVVKL
eukprot:TRINITY_DN40105_c0_g1_i1.p1 TRINITY_DN40105_c0_g1~~TRINITY_DN40105_c0_g1_i1.p1  ORF type:complete len:267 (+),score=91.44 TRINITY_DN40105_c0_g1_i1:116-916(+)